ncbi:WD repeat-containing protein 73-like [Saccostrea echinata]|uniref:WD repeat-containing protein 73-like n=1 Tax=Saccostrea echinata TaxID=191078 RepID=UPI002A7FBEFF|nr:WD repeat-containing protein 73-like [Saccostrea echinata]
MTANSTEDDDWLFDSVTRYKHLHMYDLQYPVTALAWIDTNGVCVATRGMSKHEVTELSLPDKLCTTEDMALSKNRDFQVLTGGFSSTEIRDIKHIPGTRLICTSAVNVEGQLVVWKLGSRDTDLIKIDRKLKNVKPRGSWSLIAVQEQDHVTFGSHGDNLCCTDIMTQSVVQDTSEFSNADKITSIRNMDSHTVYCCLINGQLLKWDRREKFPVVLDTNCVQSARWTLDLSGNDVVQISCNGHVYFLDARKPDQVINSNNIGLTSSNVESLRICLKKKNDYPMQYSISGFDGKVYLYSRDSSSPVFVHEGHIRNCCDDPSVVRVVTHLSHSAENIILSAATDGSLHAWQNT